MSGDLHNPLFARVYAWLDAQPDERADAHRRELLEGLTGRVIEVGAGAGSDFRHYPPTVTEVVAVEPEPYLREAAKRAASEADARVPVQVLPGVADELPARDGEFDAAVASLMLCSVPSQTRALGEMMRVLRPGGEPRSYEHVAAKDPRLARTQRLLMRVGWKRLAGNCHLDRDTLRAIESAGFDVERVRRFSFVPSALVRAIEPHVIGVALRP